MRPQLTDAARFPAALLFVALLVGACSGAAASPSASPSIRGESPSISGAPSSPPASSASPSEAAGAASTDAPTGCFGLAEAECLGVREVALSRLPADSPEIAYVRVGRFGCTVDAACAPTLAERPEGAVVFEFVDGSTPVVVSIKAVGDGIQARVEQEVYYVLVQPQSAPISGPNVKTELGHCGVGSGIDVDGSFWDPVGVVDSDHSDFFNAAPATFSLLTPTTARIRTDSGMQLELVRHPGGKQLELCD